MCNVKGTCQLVCHLLPKFGEISLLLKGPCTLDIMGLCETFLNIQVDNNILNIDGYDFERRDREGKSGGGILVYISNMLNYKRRHDLELGGIESIWIEISIPNSKPILVCSVYRPPSAPCSWVTELCCEINRASCDDKEMIIMGDYNIDHLKDITRYWLLNKLLKNLT